MLNLALRALPKALSSEETLGKAPFESILLPVWYVLTLQQAVQTFAVKPLVTCQEALWQHGGSQIHHVSKYLYSYLLH